VAGGERLIVEGDGQSRLFILVRGSVTISRDDVVVAHIDEPGAVFGELAALLDVPATATVRAAEDCVLRRCDAPLEFLRGEPEVALAIATMLARRLDALTSYLVDVRAQYAERDDHLGIVDIVLESLTHHQGPGSDPGSDREADAPY
jgi:CRP/FNR family transcriptional regulator, cyclic AMP receptor protein